MTEPFEHTLLIVDDEADILDSVERLFRKEYRVFTAQTTAAARSLLAEEDIQVVMTDQRMPSASGVDLLADIRESHPEVVRVLLTGYSNIDHVIDAINQGHVYRYISKPWDPSEFKSVVRQCFERWESRRERRRLVEQLEEQNRLLMEKNEELKTLDRVKDVFMEVVSHELNTPIAVILGYAFLLKRETVDVENEVISKAVTGIEGSGHRLKNISTSIFKMLDHSAPEALNLRNLSLGDFLATVRDDASIFLAKRNQTVEILLDDPAMFIRGDEAKLRDVFLNLLMNAIKFSYDGQTISFQVEPDDEPGFVVIRVIDEGIGIAEEDRSQVFNAFFSTFESQYHSSGDFEFGKRGIGLGLAVARRFTEMHGGWIEVESERGDGSVFSVHLPSDAGASE